MVSPPKPPPKPAPKPAPKADRPKPQNACDHCRQRKLRCDGGLPSCSNCALYEKHCNYVVGRNKSGPPKGYKRKKPAELSAEQSPAQQRRRATRSRANASRSPPAEGERATQVSPHIAPIDAFQVPPPLTRDNSPASNGSSLPDPLPSSSWISPLSVPMASPPESSLASYYTSQMTYSFSDMPAMGDPAMGDPVFATLLTDPTDPFSDLHFPQQPLAHPYSHAYPSPPEPLPEMFHLPQYSPPSTDAWPGLPAAHAFVPLLPIATLRTLAAQCSATRASSVHAAFFTHALQALTAVFAPALPEPSPALHAAQNEAMPAYLDVLARAPPAPFVHQASAVDTAAATAAALTYLGVRAALTGAPTKDAATWLRLARDVVDAPAFPPAHREWFARVGWVWACALRALGTDPALPPPAPPPGPAPAPGAQHDDYQREFAALAALFRDLEPLAAQIRAHAARVAPADASPQAYAHAARSPLCMRVRAWLQTSALGQEALLHFAGEYSAAAPPAGEAAAARVLAGVVLHLIYYGMAIKFGIADPARCPLRKTSAYVAITRIADAIEWLAAAGHSWMYGFAHPAVGVAREYILFNCGLAGAGADAPTADPVFPPTTALAGVRPATYSAHAAQGALSPTTGECTLLTLLRDVLAAAAPRLRAPHAGMAARGAEELARSLAAATALAQAHRAAPQAWDPLALDWPADRQSGVKAF